MESLETEKHKYALIKQIEAAQDNYSIVCNSLDDKARGYLLGVLNFKNFNVQVRNESATITVNDKHEICIFNKHSFGQVWSFDPYLSWFSSTATSDEVSLLEYLSFLGSFAKDMMSATGFCRAYLKSLIIEQKISHAILLALYAELDVIKRDERLFEIQEILLRAEENMISGVEFRVKSFSHEKYRKSNIRISANIKILEVTQKCVTVNISRADPDVFLSVKRYTKQDFLGLFSTELSKIILTH